MSRTARRSDWKAEPGEAPADDDDSLSAHVRSLLPATLRHLRSRPAPAKSA